MKSRRKGLVVSVAIAIFATSGVLDVAMAAKQKKISREQAWRLCKAELDKEKTPSNMTTNDRFIRGGACLMRYGYSL